MGAPHRAPRAQGKLVLPAVVKHEVAASHPPSTPTKTSGTYIPEPQSQRILQRYVSGQSIRSIARAEGRDRSTITKVVRSDQMQEYVQNMKERFYGLGCAAMDALEYGLVIEKDSRLAYQLLRDVGIIPSIEDRRVASIPAAVVGQDRDAGVKRVMAGLANIAFKRAHVYGTPLGQMEEDLEQAGGKFDHDAGRITVIDEG